MQRAQVGLMLGFREARCPGAEEHGLGRRAAAGVGTRQLHKPVWSDTRYEGDIVDQHLSVLFGRVTACCKKLNIIFNQGACPTALGPRNSV